jgi:hypothetical protein
MLGFFATDGGISRYPVKYECNDGRVRASFLMCSELYSDCPGAMRTCVSAAGHQRRECLPLQVEHKYEMLFHLTSNNDEMLSLFLEVAGDRGLSRDPNQQDQPGGNAAAPDAIDLTIDDVDLDDPLGADIPRGEKQLFARGTMVLKALLQDGCVPHCPLSLKSLMCHCN